MESIKGFENIVFICSGVALFNKIKDHTKSNQTTGFGASAALSCGNNFYNRFNDIKTNILVNSIFIVK